MPYNKNILGWMRERELQILEKLARNVPRHGVVVEVGSMFGRSAAVWAMTCDPTVDIYCIDTFPDSFTQTHNFSFKECQKNGYPLNNTSYPMYMIFLHNIRDFKNIKVLRGFSPKEITYPGYEMDLFFLDAAHTNPSDWENLEYFLPFIKQGGIICGHDHNQQYPDVITNVKRLEERLDTPVTLHRGSSIWSFKV